ncbi:MAG: hypothetical protein VYC38_10320 [Pseudomonadota bacterium]|nr:hypothetical protein [Pseudomonadota bacterium]
MIRLIGTMFFFAVLVPLPAMAGKMTIENKNCSTFLQGDVVRVHIWDTKFPASDEDPEWDKPCTFHGGYTVRKGHTKTVHLVDIAILDESDPSSRTHRCRYKHEAHGTVDGKRDVSGARDHSRVVCEKQGVVCQCRKIGL